MAVRLCSCQSYQKYCQTFRAWITSTRRCDTRSERCGVPSDGLKTGKWKKQSASVAPSEAYATKSDKEANEYWMARYRELKMGTRISDWRRERRGPTNSGRCRTQRRSRGKGSKPKNGSYKMVIESSLWFDESRKCANGAKCSWILEGWTAPTWQESKWDNKSDCLRSKQRICRGQASFAMPIAAPPAGIHR